MDGNVVLFGIILCQLNLLNILNVVLDTDLDVVMLNVVDRTLLLRRDRSEIRSNSPRCVDLS